MFSMEFPYYRNFTKPELVTCPVPGANFEVDCLYKKDHYRSLGKISLPIGDQTHWNLIFNWFFEPFRLEQQRDYGHSLAEHWADCKDDYLITAESEGFDHRAFRLWLEKRSPLTPVISPTCITALCQQLQAKRIIDPLSRYGEVLLAGIQAPDFFESVIAQHPDQKYTKPRNKLLENWKVSKSLVSRIASNKLPGQIDLVFSSLTESKGITEYKSWFYPVLMKVFFYLYPHLRPDGYLALHLTDPYLVHRLKKEIPPMGFRFSGIMYTNSSDCIYVWKKRS